jgi:OOP family OmpA-OmpF porin
MKKITQLLILLLLWIHMSCTVLKQDQTDLFTNYNSDLMLKYDCNKDLDLFGGTYYLKVNTVFIILDASISMSDPYMGQSKYSIATSILKRMNLMMPDISLSKKYDEKAHEQMNAGMRTFGHKDSLFEGSTNLVADISPFSRDRFEKIFKKLPAPYGESPLDKAILASIIDIDAAIKKLEFTQKDDVAVIILSDWEALDSSYQQAMMKLINSHEERIHIYSILIGNNLLAKKKLNEFTQSHSYIDFKHHQDLSNDNALYTFAKDIFLTDKKPDREKLNLKDSGTGTGSTSNPHVRREDYLLDQAILFDLNSFEIKPEYHEILAKAAEKFLVNINACYEIEGHTDRTGPVEFNQILSTKRAKTVSNFIKKQLKDKLSSAYLKNIIIKGYGSNKASGNKDNNPKERRVQIRKIQCQN